MSTTNSNEPQQGGVTDETAEFGDRADVPVAGSTENHGDVEQPVAPGTDDEPDHLTGREATSDVLDRTGTVDSADVDDLLGRREDRDDDHEGPRAP